MRELYYKYMYVERGEYKNPEEEKTKNSTL